MHGHHDSSVSRSSLPENTEHFFFLNVLFYFILLQANRAKSRVGQITPLFFSKRLVSMVKFDVEDESVNRFYV